MSIPEVVREIIHRNRSIFDCMKMDLIIEKILGNSVNLNTVVVAIKRFADSFEIKEDIKEELVLKNARLSLTDGIMDVKFSVKDSNEMDPMVILDKFSKITNNYDFFRMSDSFRFLTEDLEDIRQIFRNVPENDDMFSTGLAKIRISIPNSQNQSDVVELVNAFFSQDNITIILNERDSSRAYDILHSDIMRT